MRLMMGAIVIVVTVTLFSGPAVASDRGPVAWWKFDELVERKIERPFEEEEMTLEEEMEALRRELTELQEDMTRAEGEAKQELENGIEELRREIEALEEEMEAEEAEDAFEEEEEDEIAVLEEEIQELQQEMETVREEMERAQGERAKRRLREELRELGEESDGLQGELEDLEEEEKEMEVITVRLVLDAVSGVEDEVQGAYVKMVPGVLGYALQLDGNTSYITRHESDAPTVSGDFSVEAWIALGAYPTNWCPIADHCSAVEKGYFLGIDALGHVGFGMATDATDEEWHHIRSPARISLRKWTHVAGVYRPEEGMSLFVDGKRVARSAVEGEFVPALGDDLLIGRHSIERKPYGTLRPNATAAVFTFYDGLIDELKVHDRCLGPDEIAKYVSKTRPKGRPALSERILPAGPKGPGRFGAYYTTLKYYDAWDRPWRVGDHADVVVRFDESPCRFVFWRGTSYIPHWVTENGIWYDNEFNETWSDKGCHEPMSDKRCHHSHVRVIESNDARAVVHWRYALVDNWYNLAKVDELTGWGDWTDEVYTIYPDMVAVRKITLHSSQPASPHEWHEAIIVMGPGQRPEQVLHPEALTLANMAGETHTYSWRHGAPGKDGLATEPEGANIHLVNTRSEYRPFVIVSPDSDPVFDIYAGELRRDVSMFPWWNHWPTAQKPSDGRYAMDSDLASHSSLSHCNWKAYSRTDNSMTKIMLNGLTTKAADRLVPLAGSWAQPPELKLKKGVSGTNYASDGYDPTERAYQLSCKRNGRPSTLDFELVASEASPAVNPAFVVKNWNRKGATVKVDGKEIPPGKDLRIGHRSSPEGRDLIVWFRIESDEPLRITLKPTRS